jgi:hypothetical protein
VITGAHAIVFSEDAERTRAFFRDTLQLDSIDADGGWLIFALPPTDWQRTRPPGLLVTSCT